MIYSVHNPLNGGFIYYEAAPDVPLNDDLPTPRWGGGVRTKIGIAASVAARPLPPGASQVGSGTQPVGLISSGQAGLWTGTSKGGIPSGLGSFSSGGSVLPMTLSAGAGAAAIYAVVKPGKVCWLSAATAVVLGSVAAFLAWRQ